eukprot:UC4_evm7s1370
MRRFTHISSYAKYITAFTGFTILLVLLRTFFWEQLLYPTYLEGNTFLVSKESNLSDIILVSTSAPTKDVAISELDHEDSHNDIQLVTRKLRDEVGLRYVPHYIHVSEEKPTYEEVAKGARSAYPNAQTFIFTNDDIVFSYRDLLRVVDILEAARNDFLTPNYMAVGFRYNIDYKKAEGKSFREAMDSAVKFQNNAMDVFIVNAEHDWSSKKGIIWGKMKGDNFLTDAVYHDSLATLIDFSLLMPCLHIGVDFKGGHVHEPSMFENEQIGKKISNQKDPFDHGHITDSTHLITKSGILCRKEWYIYSECRKIGSEISMTYSFDLFYKDFVQSPSFTYELIIVVLAANRPSSLLRLLRSLEATKYGGDAVWLRVEIDKNKNSHLCLHVAQNFRFSWGRKTVEVSAKKKGLREAWLKAWRPLGNQRAIIFEDDIIVSPEWYLWLKKAWKQYSQNTNIAGISLMRQTLIPKKPSEQKEIENGHVPFFYALVGSIGFSPHPQQWKRFLSWMRANGPDNIDVSTPDLVTYDYYKNGDKRQMWTQHFIQFCRNHNLYTLYVNLQSGETLAAHMREKGVHYKSTDGQDFPIASVIASTSFSFPTIPKMYGWGGELLNIGMEEEKYTINLESSDILMRNALNTISDINSQYGVAIIQVFNDGFIEMTKSWVCNVKRFDKVLDRTVFVATTKTSYQKMKNFNDDLKVVLIPFHATGDLSYGKYSYFDYMLFRSWLIFDLLRSGVTLWIIESDAVWLKNPIDLVLETKGDIVTANNAAPPRKELSGGFLLLRPTELTIKLWAKMVYRFESIMNDIHADENIGNAGSEQIQLNILISRERGLKVVFLPVPEFISGLWYRGEYKFSKEKQSLVIQNNWLIGNEDKIGRAKKYNHWYLNDNGNCKIDL